MSEYDTDLVTWSEHQAELLRRMGAGERVNDRVDWANVAEEIESLGRSDRRELHNRIATILEHLIKLQVSPATEPREGWRDTIIHARRRLGRLVKDSPSLRPGIPDAIAEELPGAIEDAAAGLFRYGEPNVPTDLTFTEDQVLGPWLPD